MVDGVVASTLCNGDSFGEVRVCVRACVRARVSASVHVCVHL